MIYPRKDPLCPRGHRFLIYLHNEADSDSAQALLDRMFPPDKTKDAVLVEVRGDGWKPSGSGRSVKLNGYRVYIPLTESSDGRS